MKVDLNSILLFLEDLPLVAFGLSMQMQKSITICTQIPTVIAKDYGQSFAIIVIVTSWPRGCGLS